MHWISAASVVGIGPKWLSIDRASGSQWPRVALFALAGGLSRKNCVNHSLTVVARKRFPIRARKRAVLKSWNSNFMTSDRHKSVLPAGDLELKGEKRTTTAFQFHPFSGFDKGKTTAVQVE